MPVDTSRFLAFVGPKGAGKDTIADVIVGYTPEEVKDLDMQFIKVSFASNLKNICKTIFNISDRQLHDPVGKEEAFDTPIVLTESHFNSIYAQCVDIMPTYTVDTVHYEAAMCASPRELLQYVGVYIRNNIHKDWHLNAALETASRLQVLEETKNGGIRVYVIFTDCRFSNELNAIANNGNTFYISRKPAEAILATATHESETNVRILRSMIEDERFKAYGRVVDNNKDIKWAVDQVLFTTLMRDM